MEFWGWGSLLRDSGWGEWLEKNQGVVCVGVGNHLSGDDAWAYLVQH